MTKLKRLISAVLLLGMIASMIPLTPRVSAAEPVKYVLDTGGIDVGAAYLIIRYSAFLGKAIVLSGAGAPDDEAPVLYSIGSEISYFTGEETVVDPFESAKLQARLLFATVHTWLQTEAGGAL